MIRVQREGTVQANAEQLHVLLADPQSMPKLLPRIKRVEVGASDQGGTHVVTHMSFGGPLGLQRYSGVLRSSPEAIWFEASKPFAVLARWTLVPDGESTQVTALLELDLDTLLKPLGRFGSKKVLATIEQDIGEELEQSLRRIDWLMNKA